MLKITQSSVNKFQKKILLEFREFFSSKTKLYVAIFAFSLVAVSLLISLTLSEKNNLNARANANYKATVLGDTPVVYYRLDEASGTTLTDSSGFGRNGIYASSGVTYNQPGAVNDGDTAVSINGNGEIGQYTAATGLPVSNTSRSAEVWFKTTQTQSSNGGVFLAWGSETGTNLFSMKAYTGTQIKLTNWNNNYFFNLPTGANAFDGNWHYVVAVFDGSKTTVYYDNTNVGTQNTIFTTVLNPSKGLVLGAQMGANNSNYKGMLDEVAVYNYVLTPGQIANHYMAGIAGGITPTNTPTPIAGPLPDGHYLYALTDGGMYIYNMDAGFSFVKQKTLPTGSGTRGVAADPATHALFISFGGDGGSHGNGSVLKYDLLTDQIVWNSSYTHGIDSIALTPDGTKIYVPDGEQNGDGKWYVVNATTGNETGSIIDTNAGTGDNGPHNTVVSLDGQYVYMGDRNLNPGSNYFYMASTATNAVIKKIGPFQSGIRPFTVNSVNTLVYTAVTNFLGFQVGDLNTGNVLYTVPITTPSGASCTNSGATAPSHGITLSPDEKNLYIIDYTCNYVHQFDVSNVPASAPVQKADIPVAQFNPAENPCAYDCLGDGWLLHSIDGNYVVVGDSGSIIKTTDNSLVSADNSPTGFSTILHNTRKFIEVDWQCGVPVSTTTRHGIGRVGFPTPTPASCASPTTTPIVAPTNTPTPTPTLSPTPTPTATLTPTPAATATPTPQPTQGASAYRSAILADAPLFYYRLDENSGTIANDIAGAHTGIYTSAVLNQIGATTDGDKAAGGNGLMMKYTAGTGLPVGVAARTVEFWFKTTAAPSSPYGSTFLSWGSGNNNQMFAAKIYQNGNINYMKLTNWAATYLYAVPAGANPLDGNWHYVVVTFDGANSIVYYDGQNLGQQATSFNTILNSSGLYLGIQTPNNGSPYVGSLDEVAIYNYVLSPAQVQTHYNNR